MRIRNETSIVSGKSASQVAFNVGKDDEKENHVKRIRKQKKMR